MDNIDKFFEEAGGVASIPDVADLLDADEGYVREWARDEDLPKVGTSFVFHVEDARRLADDLEEDDDTIDEDEEDDDGDEDDEGA